MNTRPVRARAVTYEQQMSDLHVALHTGRISARDFLRGKRRANRRRALSEIVLWAGLIVSLVGVAMIATGGMWAFIVAMAWMLSGDAPAAVGPVQ